ncbi:MAG: hypothetical protein NT041_00235, partial [Candidatus Vogelbacteria bacterium]|nr:hypothetical protein [Candidatus Vogelbacteria bacterium]
MTAMFKNLIHKKLLILGLLIGVVVLLAPVMVVKAADNYMDGKSVVSQNLSDPTKNSNSPYAEGLPLVRGVPYKDPLPKDSTALSAKINEFKQINDELVSAKVLLQTERARVNEIASKWKVAHLADVTGNLVSADPDSIVYNRYRLQIIDTMRVNVDMKIRAMNHSMASCVVKISEIELNTALASENSDQIALARTHVDQAIADRKIAKDALLQKMADIKALNDASCWPGGSWTPDIGNCILIGTSWVGNIITWIFALLLWIASKIFDLSVYISISLIGAWFTQPAVVTAWKLCRDLANLCFVFVLLYIALGTVFESASVGNPQKLIVSVVVIALLVNFSGFFTRIVIDASNVIAYEFYSQMSSGGTIATKLVEKMELGSYFIKDQTLTGARGTASSKVEPPVVERLSFLSIIAQTFGNIIIILVTSFVLLAAAIMFLIRTVYLLFLYIFSPLAFVAYAIPGQSKFFTQWKDKLISQAFFAPAFLIPLYIVFVLLGKDGIVGLTGTSAGFLAIPIVDAIIIGLLLGCIMIANQMGAAGAKMATGIAGSATLLGAKGMTKGFGATGRFVGRNTVGAAGRGVSAWAERVEQANLHPVWGTPGPGRIASRLASAVKRTENDGRIISAGAKTIWDSKTGKAIRGSEVGKKVGGIVKNPLLATNDAIQDIINAKGGGGSTSFLGRT